MIGRPTPVTSRMNNGQCNSLTSDIMDAAELAAVLRLHPVTVRLQADAGRIPGRKIGNRWRFSRAVITEWMQRGGEFYAEGVAK